MCPRCAHRVAKIRLRANVWSMTNVSQRDKRNQVICSMGAIVQIHKETAMALRDGVYVFAKSLRADAVGSIAILASPPFKFD
jgi:hypothetical protein